LIEKLSVFFPIVTYIQGNRLPKQEKMYGRTRFCPWEIDWIWMVVVCYWWILCEWQVVQEWVKVTLIKDYEGTWF